MLRKRGLPPQRWIFIGLIDEFAMVCQGNSLIGFLTKKAPNSDFDQEHLEHLVSPTCQGPAIAPPSPRHHPLATLGHPF